LLALPTLDFHCGTARHYGSLVKNPNPSAICGDRFVLEVAGAENSDHFGFGLLQSACVRIDQVIGKDAIESGDVDMLHGPKALALEISDLPLSVSSGLRPGERQQINKRNRGKDNSIHSFLLY